MGGFFGMLKENKYIQKGWDFNPREVLKESQTNSCADSTALGVAGSAAFAQCHREPSQGSFLGFFQGCSVEQSLTELKSELPDSGSAAAGGEKPSLWQVTPMPAAPTRLYFCFCSLSGSLFLPFCRQPLNIFPLWPLQNPPSYPRGFQQVSEQPARAPCQANPLAF